MNRNIILLFIAFLCSFAHAQDLGRLIRQACTFDDRFPRETVYLHTDNASYLKGDTLWYKAYVVRASTHRPDSTLSRTLYVELLNDAGTLLQRSILHLDTKGQANGNFALAPPLQGGFYEIRAYTRAMTNWFSPFNPARGEAKDNLKRDCTPECDTGNVGYFSHVFPLFELPPKALPGDFTKLNIQCPESEQYFKLPHERPYDFGNEKERRLEFFPEGGSLPFGISTHVAYRLTDGKGMPAEDSIAVFSAQGHLLCKSFPVSEGMGTLVLPCASPGTYAQVVGKRHTYPLPQPSCCAIALHAYTDIDEESHLPVLNLDLQPAEGMITTDAEGNEKTLNVAVIAISHEKPYRVYPVELHSDVTTLVIDHQDLKPGITRLEIIDVEGHSLAWRMVASPPQSSAFDTATDTVTMSSHKKGKCEVTVRQNAFSYEAFDPIAIEVEVKDENGHPVPFAELSVSIRDDRGDLILNKQPTLSTQLQYASELKGQVPYPLLQSLHDHTSTGLLPKAASDLDLLLQVQGWRPETMEALCLPDSFPLRQPMENYPIIRGRIIKDTDGTVPLPNAELDMTMYNDRWHVLRANTRTNSEGIFAFESHEDFTGDLTTQFTVKNSRGNTVWHRVMLDQWFGPKPKKYSPYEMQTTAPLHLPPSVKGSESSERGQQEQVLHPACKGSLPNGEVGERGLEDEEELLFEWTDTIPRTVNTLLGEAVVRGKKPFAFELIGQEFNRYTYGGGEAQSIRHSDTYFNVDIELQRIRDCGIDLFTIRDFLCHLIDDRDKALNPDPMITGTAVATGSIQTNGKAQNDEPTIPDDESLQNKADGQETTEPDNGIPESLNVGGRKFYVIVNNLAGIPENLKGMQMPEQLKSVIVSYNAAWATQLWSRHHEQSTEHFDGIIYVHTRPDWYNFRRHKGTEKRILHGITPPDEFHGPDYRRTDAENDEDYRRTLYWNPSLTTDANGKATAIFYANARWRQRLRITVRGITSDGKIMEYDR